MLNFEFVSPTKYVFGRGAENSCGKAIAETGAKRVMMLYYSDPNFLKNGLVDRVRASVKGAGLETVEMSGIVPNARLSTVKEGIVIAKQEQVDFILAIGGGSVIDTAKGIAIGVLYDGDVWDFYCGKASVEKALPVGAVVTIAAAGSESSRVSVITKEEGQLKKACPSDLIRPAIAILDPEMAFSVPKFQIACGAVDILMHVFERYFSPSVDVDLTDRLCEAVMLAVIRAGKQAYDDPTDYEAQATLMWAAGMAQNDFLSTGRAKDGVCHNVEHEIGGIYDVTHGAGLSAIWTAWAHYVYQSNLNRFVQFATRVWGCEMNYDHPEETALDGIARMNAYMKSVGLPTNLRELGIGPIPEEAIDTLADKATNGGKTTMGGIRVLDKQDIKNMLALAQ